MPQTDLERLVVTLEARFSGFEKAFKNLQQNVNQSATRIETRTSQMTSKIEAAFNRLGPRLTSTGKVIFGGALVYGLERFTSSLIDTVSKIQDTADAIGISTDALQTWTILAAKAGVKQDDFTSAIDRFAKTLGEAQIKGTPVRKLLNDLGVDVTAGVDKAFLQLADGLSQVGDQGQRVAAVTALMGRSSAQLTALVSQGSAALLAQGDVLKRTGSILSEEMIKKIDDLGDKWTEVRAKLLVTGGNVLGGFADEFSKFADQLQDPQFQSSLKNLGQILGQVSVALIKAAPYFPAIAGALAGLKLTGSLGLPLPARLAGAAAGAVIGAEAFKSTEIKIKETQDKIEQLQKDLDKPFPILKFSVHSELAAYKTYLQGLQEEQAKVLSTELKDAEENVKRVQALDPAKQTFPALDEAKARAEEVRTKIKDLLTIPGEAISKIEVPRLDGLANDLKSVADLTRLISAGTGTLATDFNVAAEVLKVRLAAELVKAEEKVKDIQKAMRAPPPEEIITPEGQVVPGKKITVDTSELDAAQARVDALRKEIEALPPAVVQVDTTKLENEIRDVQALIKKLEIKDPLSKELVDAKARLAELVAQLTKLSPIDIQFKKNTIAADLREAQELVKRLERSTPLGSVTPDLAKARTEVLRLQTLFNEISKTPIYVDLQIRKAHFEEELRNAEAKLKELEKRPGIVGPQFNPELAKTQTQIEQITTQLKALSDVPVDIHVERADLENQLRDAQAAFDKLRFKDPFSPDIDEALSKIAVLTARLSQTVITVPVDPQFDRAKLETDLRQAQDTVDALQIKDTFSSALDDAKAKVVDLRARLESVSNIALHASIDAKVDKAELESQLKQAEAVARRSFGQSFDAANAKVTELRAKLAALSSVPIGVDISDLEKQLKQAEAVARRSFGESFDKANAKVTELRAKLNSLSRLGLVDQLKQAEAALKGLQDENILGPALDNAKTKVAELRAQLDGIATVRVHVDVDRAGLEDQLKQAEASVKQLETELERAKPPINPALEEAGAKLAELQAQLESLSKKSISVPVNTQFDRTTLEAQIKQAQADVDALEIKDNFSTALDEAKAKVSELTAQLANVSPITIHIQKIDLEDQLKRAQATVEELERSTPLASVGPALDEANAKVTDIAAQLDKISKAPISVDIQVKKLDLEDQLKRAQGTAKALEDGLALLGPTLAAAKRKVDELGSAKLDEGTAVWKQLAQLSKAQAILKSLEHQQIQIESPDLDKLKAKVAELQTQLEKAPILSVETGVLSQQLLEARAQLKDLEKQTLIPVSTASLEQANANIASLRTQLKELSEGASVTLYLDKNELEKQLKQAQDEVKGLENQQIADPFGHALEEAKAKVLELTDQLEKVSKVPVSVDLKIKTNLETELKKAQDIVKQLENQVVPTPSISPALDAAKTKLAELMAQLDTASKVSIDLPVTPEFDRTKLEEQIKQAKAAVEALQIKDPLSPALLDAKAKVVELRTQLESVSKTPIYATIDARIDKAGLEDQLKQAQVAAEALQIKDPFGTAFEQAKVKVVALKTQLESVSKISIDIQAKVGLTDQLKQAEDVVNTLQIKDPFGPALNTAKAKVAELRTKLVELSSKPIGVQINLAKINLGDQLKQAEVAVRQLESQTPFASYAPALEEAKAKVVELKSQLDSLSKDSITVPVDTEFDRAKLENQLKQAEAVARRSFGQSFDAANAKVIELRNRLEALSKEALSKPAPINIPIDAQLDKAGLETQLKQAEAIAKRTFGEAFGKANARVIELRRQLEALPKVSVSIDTQLDRAGLETQLKQAEAVAKRSFGESFERANAKVTEIRTKLEAISKIPISIQTAKIGLVEKLREAEAVIERLKDDVPFGRAMDEAVAKADVLRKTLVDLSGAPVDIQINLAKVEVGEELQKAEALLKAQLGAVNPELERANANVATLKKQLVDLASKPITVVQWNLEKKDLEDQLTKAEAIATRIASKALVSPALQKDAAKVAELRAEFDALNKVSILIPIATQFDKDTLEKQIAQLKSDIEVLQIKVPFSASALKDAKTKISELKTKLDEVSKIPVDVTIDMTLDKAGLEEQLKRAQDAAAELKIKEPFGDAFKQAEAKVAALEAQLKSVSKISIDIQTKIGLVDQINEAKTALDNLRIKNPLDPAIADAESKLAQLRAHLVDFASKPISVQINLAKIDLGDRLQKAEAALRRLETQGAANPALDRAKVKLDALQAQLTALSKRQIDVPVIPQFDKAQLEADLAQAKKNLEQIRIKDPSSKAFTEALDKVAAIQIKLDALSDRPVYVPIEMRLDRAALEKQLKQAEADASKLKLADPFSTAFKEAEAKVAVLRNELQSLSKISIDIQTKIGLIDQLKEAKKELENLRARDAIGPVMDAAKAKVVALEAKLAEFSSKPINVQINLATAEITNQLKEAEAVVKRLEAKNPFDPALNTARVRVAELTAKLQSLTKIIPISISLKTDLEKQLSDLQKKMKDLAKPLVLRAVSPEVTQLRNEIIALRAQIALVSDNPIDIPVKKLNLEKQLVLAKQAVEDFKIIDPFGAGLKNAQADVLLIQRQLDKLSPVTIEIKKVQLEADLKKAETELDRIQKLTPFAGYKPALDEANAKVTEIKAQLADISRTPVYINFQIKKLGLRAGLEAELTAAKDEFNRLFHEETLKHQGFSHIFDKASPALEEADRLVKQITADMKKLDDATPEQLADIKVPNEDVIKAQIAEVLANIEQLNQVAAQLGTEVGKANPELDAANAKLLELRASLLALYKENPRLQILAELKESQIEMNALHLQLAALSNVSISLDGLEISGLQIADETKSISDEIEKRIVVLQGKIDELNNVLATFLPKVSITPGVDWEKRSKNLQDALVNLGNAEDSVIKRTALAAAAAERDRARAVNEANAQILEDTTSVYDAIEKKIEQNAAAEKAAAKEKFDAQMEEFRAKQAQDARELKITPGSALELEQKKKQGQAEANLKRELAADLAKIDADTRSQHLANLRKQKDDEFRLAEEVLELTHSVAAARISAIAEVTQATSASFAAERRQIQSEAAAQQRIIDANLKNRLDYLNSVHEASGGLFPTFDTDVNTATQDAEKKTQILRQETHAKTMANIRAERDEAFRTQEEIFDSHRSRAEAETALRVQLAQGTGQQYALEREQANEQADHELARVRETTDAHTAALDQSIEDLGNYENYLLENRDLVEKLEEDKTNARVLASDKEREIEARRQADLDRIREDELRTKARAVEVSDALRDGLEDLGIAAISGSKNLQQAVAQMLRDLGLLIIKLYILRPLIQAAFGAPGTSGGGFFGGLFGGAKTGFSVADAAASTGFSGLAAGAKGMVFGPRGEIPLRRFGKGGVARAGRPQMAIYAEGSQNEAFVPLPDGRRIPVDLRVPPTRNVSRGPSTLVVRNEIYLQGANGDETIRRIARQASVEGSQFAISTIQKNFPGMMVKASRDDL